MFDFQICISVPLTNIYLCWQLPLDSDVFFEAQVWLMTILKTVTKL